jgi:hypothetical protein
MTVLHTRWPQPCGCVLSAAVDKFGTLHGVTIAQACSLHGAAEALYDALHAVLGATPDAADEPPLYARAREALARAARPPAST